MSKNISPPSPQDFMMVGARFSRIQIDETAFFSTATEGYNMAIGVHAPKVSDHQFGDRSVIEITVAARVVPEDESAGAKLASEVLLLECVAGFVGDHAEYDGDLERFAPLSSFYSRAVYWMLRERLQSILSVTLFRHGEDLPWDLDRETIVGIERLPSKAKKKLKK